MIYTSTNTQQHTTHHTTQTLQKPGQKLTTNTQHYDTHHKEHIIKSHHTPHTPLVS
jgi:hypothetical protein